MELKVELKCCNGETDKSGDPLKESTRKSKISSLIVGTIGLLVVTIVRHTHEEVLRDDIDYTIINTCIIPPILVTLAKWICICCYGCSKLDKSSKCHKFELVISIIKTVLGGVGAGFIWKALIEQISRASVLTTLAAIFSTLSTLCYGNEVVHELRELGILESWFSDDDNNTKPNAPTDEDDDGLCGGNNGELDSDSYPNESFDQQSEDVSISIGNESQPNGAASNMNSNLDSNVKSPLNNATTEVNKVINKEESTKTDKNNKLKGPKGVKTKVKGKIYAAFDVD